MPTVDRPPPSSPLPPRKKIEIFPGSPPRGAFLLELFLSFEHDRTVRRRPRVDVGPVIITFDLLCTILLHGFKHDRMVHLCWPSFAVGISRRSRDEYTHAADARARTILGSKAWDSERWLKGGVQRWR